jgi:hypothetical protein
VWLIPHPSALSCVSIIRVHATHTRHQPTGEVGYASGNASIPLTSGCCWGVCSSGLQSLNKMVAGLTPAQRLGYLFIFAVASIWVLASFLVQVRTATGVRQLREASPVALVCSICVLVSVESGIDALLHRVWVRSAAEGCTVELRRSFPPLLKSEAVQLNAPATGGLAPRFASGGRSGQRAQLVELRRRGSP